MYGFEDGSIGIVVRKDVRAADAERPDAVMV
jgi:hypothetical protein